MAAPVYAPQVPTYATYTPYLTVAEFLAEPSGVDTSQLIPGGTYAENRAALARLIARASSEADRICQQVLAATIDVQAGTYRLRDDGTIGIPVAYTPLIQINDVSVGPGPSRLTSLASLADVRITRKVAWVPVPALASSCGSVYAQMTYVNGHAHTLLAQDAALGAVSVAVRSALGVFPGLPMAIYDSASTESVVVDASYTPGSTTVPLASPLQFAHASGVTLSALPPFVRDAVINLVSSMVKTRGAEAVQMGSISAEPSKPQPTMPSGTTEYNDAVAQLQPLRRVT